MNKLNFITCVLLLAFLSSEEVYYWDFGLKVESKKTRYDLLENSNSTNTNITRKKAILANRKIDSKLKQLIVKSEFVNQANYLEKMMEESPQKYNSAISSLGETEYLKGRYVSAISYFKILNLNLLSKERKNKLIYYYSDSNYQIGDYKRTIQIIDELDYDLLSEELLLLYSFSNIKVGNKSKASDALLRILEINPKSDYKKLAELQIKLLRRN